MYRDEALRLMRNHSTKNLLDPLKVLNLIPEDWAIIQEGEYDLVSFLSSVFDHLLTIEENSKILIHPFSNGRLLYTVLLIKRILS